MEYTGKESYGGTVDDGGVEMKDKVIEILNKWLVFRTLERQPYRNAAIQELAKAIDDLYKGDENGLLTDETIAKIWAGGGDHKEVAKAQQALTRREGQERVEKLIGMMALERCDPDVMPYFTDYYWIPEDVIDDFKKQEGLWTRVIN